MCDANRTDSAVRAEVERIAKRKIIQEEDWQTVLEIVFKDIYANYICMGKDVPYKYFIHTAARALQLLSNS